MEKFNRPIAITITTGTIAKTILIGALFFLLLEIKDIVLVVLTAVVIASAIEPLTLWLGKRRIKRLPAVIIIYLGLALLFLAIIYFLVPTLLNEFAGYLSNLPKYLNYAQAWIPVEGQTVIENSATLQQLSSSSFSLSQVLNNVSASLTNVSEGFVRTVSLIFGGVFSFILIVVLSFYLAVQEDGIGNFLRIVTPAKHENYVISLWRRSQHKIGLWMQGQLVLAITVGVLVYLGLTVFGVSHALLLALVAALFELIPVFGPILAAIPGILVAVGDKGAVFGLVIAAVYIIIQQFENHLFYPLVVRKIIGISPIVVILALVIGAKLAGFLGILLSVPLSTTLMEYISDRQKGKAHNDEERPAVI